MNFYSLLSERITQLSITMVKKFLRSNRNEQYITEKVACSKCQRKLLNRKEKDGNFCQNCKKMNLATLNMRKAVRPGSQMNTARKVVKRILQKHRHKSYPNMNVRKNQLGGISRNKTIIDENSDEESSISSSQRSSTPSSLKSGRSSQSFNVISKNTNEFTSASSSHHPQYEDENSNQSFLSGFSSGSLKRSCTRKPPVYNLSGQQFNKHSIGSNLSASRIHPLGFDQNVVETPPQTPLAFANTSYDFSALPHAYKRGAFERIYAADLKDTSAAFKSHSLVDDLLTQHCKTLLALAYKAGLARQESLSKQQSLQSTKLSNYPNVASSTQGQSIKTEFMDTDMTDDINIGYKDSGLGRARTKKMANDISRAQIKKRGRKRKCLDAHVPQNNQTLTSANKYHNDIKEELVEDINQGQYMHVIDYDPNLDEGVTTYFKPRNPMLNVPGPFHTKNHSGQQQTSVLAYCPNLGCDSRGHLSGLFPLHSTLGGCPLFHRTTAKACAERWDQRIMPLLKNITTKYDDQHVTSPNSRNMKKSPTRLTEDAIQKKQNALSSNVKSSTHGGSKPASQNLSSPSYHLKTTNTALAGNTFSFEETYAPTQLHNESPASSPTRPVHTTSKNSKSGLVPHPKDSNNNNNNSNNLNVKETVTINTITANIMKNQQYPFDNLGVPDNPDLQIFLDVQAILAAVQEADLEPFDPPFHVSRIIFGNIWELRGWYPSPFPLDRFGRTDAVYFCEYCLDFQDSEIAYLRHSTKCKITYPPGNEIYREGALSVFEVDGRTQIAYCRNLCLLSKLFMESKTLCYEVQHFWFYVMTLADRRGSCHIIGYFSKEKQNFQKNTVSCILILPHFMRRGYGWKLIDFSYLLARLEDKIGSPERPLSDHGLVTYRSYWNTIILNYMANNCQDDKISVKDLSAESGIHPDDIVSTLQNYRLLKSWRGNHIILKKDIEEMKKNTKPLWKTLPGRVDAKFLHWTPK